MNRPLSLRIGMSLAVLLGLCLSGTVLGQDPKPPGNWPGYGGGFGAIAAQGKYGYVMNAQFQVLDLNDPSHPVVVGEVKGFAAPRAMTVIGNLAFVLSWPSLTVIDVSDARNPTIVGSCEARGNQVVVSEGYAYVLYGAGVMTVIDVRDPAWPEPLGQVRHEEEGSGYTYGGVPAVSGKRVFAVTRSGLSVFDVSDPTRPTLLGNYQADWSSGTVLLSGTDAFVLEEQKGLHLLDVSDPAKPALIAALGFYGDNMVWQGDRLVLISSVVRILDASDPLHPVVLGTYSPTPSRHSGNAIATTGQYILLEGRDLGVEVVDASDPTKPTRVGQVLQIIDARQVAASINLAVLIQNPSVFGTYMLDVSNPAKPVLASKLPAWAQTAAIIGNYVLMITANGPANLLVWDASDPAHPKEVGSCSLPRWQSPSQDIIVSGKYAYLTSPLLICDLSDPARPVLIGSNDFPIVQSALSGNYLFASSPDRQNPAVVFDVSDPTNPVRVGSFGGALGYSGLVVHGDYLLNGRTCGLDVYDVKDPTAPVKVAECSAGGVQVGGIQVSGHYAFLIEDGFRLSVYDIIDPRMPVWVGNYDLPSKAVDLVLSGNRAFVVHPTDGLSILDCSAILGQEPRLLAPIFQGGSWTIQLRGEEQSSYELWRAGEVMGPWHSLGTVSSTNGIGLFRDTTVPPGGAFYRALRK